MLNSTAGYGLLFDAGCAMIYNNVADSSYVEMEAAQEIDYYMMKGHNMDAVVANYRQLTGECPMMPQYLSAIPSRRNAIAVPRNWRVSSENIASARFRLI